MLRVSPTDRAQAAARAGKRMRNVAVLFADIEGCTRLCEDLPPREMSRVIERYFSRFLDAVRAAGGEITEILGDGLLALFVGRSLRADVAKALAAAVGIQEAAATLNAAPGQRHDPIVVHIGINAGPALVGTIRLRDRNGACQDFFTATGPVTNVAARLCALADRGQIFVAGAVAAMIPSEFAARRLGRRRLKNVSAPVEAFEIRQT